MVRVAVAGGARNVGREIIHGIVATRKHEVICLTRGNPLEPDSDYLRFVKVDYENKQQLTEILLGIDVVLSFILPFTDPGNAAQKTLIDASVAAGVKRFAPSEWASASNSGIPVYVGKERVREYLEEINREKKIIEYTLFQPGLFLNFFSYPRPSTPGKHLAMGIHYIDFETRQGILVDDGEQPATFTEIQDVARVVTAALDYPGEWPKTGGIRGWQATSAELIRLGQKIRGGPFTVHRISSKDLETNGLTTKWCPLMTHPAIPRDKAEQFSRMAQGEYMKAYPRGAWGVGDEWNKLLPGITFVNPEDFLWSHWRGQA